jgi:hypothetical protein
MEYTQKKHAIEAKNNAQYNPLDFVVFSMLKLFLQKYRLLTK